MRPTLRTGSSLRGRRYLVVEDTFIVALAVEQADGSANPHPHI
jgi:hypothetical protein